MTDARTYKIRFGGRTRGAIGAFYPITATRVATCDKDAISALYNEYEHIKAPHEILPDGTARRMSFE